MPDITVAEQNLAEGIKAKNLVIPEMPVEVLLKNVSADMQKAFKDDKLILQKMAMAADEALQDARKQLRAGIADLDASYEKTPPTDRKDAESRAATFNTVCKQIAQAQCDKAIGAAQGEWDRQAKKNKDLTKFKVVFGLKMALGTISVAASIVSAVMSMGVLAVTIIGAAKTVAGMASELYTFVRDMAKTEADIIGTDADLAKTWQNDKITAGKVGKELAAALGVPLVKSIDTLATLLAEYSAKIAKKDHIADQMWKEAKKLMAAIEKLSDAAGGEQKKKAERLGKETTKLLDGITELGALGKSNDQFHDVYEKRMETYKAMRGEKLGKTVGGVQLAVVVGGIASTADTIISIATALA